MNAMAPNTVAERRAWRNTLKRKICSRTDFANNAQYVHTPYDLCHGMVERLDQYGSLHEAQTFLTFNLEFVEVLCYSMGIEKSKIWFVTECLEKAAVARCHPRYSGINVIYADYLTWRPNMKFDVICGNPPYQTKSDAKHTNTQPLWHKFVLQSVGLLKDGGHLCFVHPSGWRDVKGTFIDVKNCLLPMRIKYLEMHSQPDGVKLFGVKTDYDWYVIQNSSPEGLTTVKGQDGIVSQVNLSNLPFIPNGMFDEVLSLLAKPGEERVNLIRDCAYHTQRPHMSKVKDKKFKYPVAYTVMKKGTKFHYSSRNDLGHFGIPKLIWGNGEIDYIGSEVDAKGEYGLTQFCYAIADDPTVLPSIKTAFDSPNFKRLMNMCAIGKFSVNEKVIGLLRKDFWKAFV